MKMNQSTLRHVDVADISLELCAALRGAQIWTDVAPAPEALQSQLPFCVDKLSFPELIQFVFLPRLTSIVEQGLPLPGKSNIASYAEEYFRLNPVNPHSPVACETILAIIRRFDRICSESNHA
ncbi:YqcC family protein [Oleiphilus messinensis]|nr:YqcC family protein [Oleiphilus messinensis]